METYAVEFSVLNSLRDHIHQLNHKWWIDIHTQQPLNRNIGELLMLVVSEIAEAMEGHRKNLRDDHLPDRSMIEVELADAMIRILYAYLTRTRPTKMRMVQLTS